MVKYTYQRKEGLNNDTYFCFFTRGGCASGCLIGKGITMDSIRKHGLDEQILILLRDSKGQKTVKELSAILPINRDKLECRIREIFTFLKRNNFSDKKIDSISPKDWRK